MKGTAPKAKFVQAGLPHDVQSLLNVSQRLLRDALRLQHEELRLQYVTLGLEARILSGFHQISFFDRDEGEKWQKPRFYPFFERFNPFEPGFGYFYTESWATL